MMKQRKVVLFMSKKVSATVKVQQLKNSGIHSLKTIPEEFCECLKSFYSLKTVTRMLITLNTGQYFPA